MADRPDDDEQKDSAVRAFCRRLSPGSALRLLLRTLPLLAVLFAVTFLIARREHYFPGHSLVFEPPRTEYFGFPPPEQKKPVPQEAGSATEGQTADPSERIRTTSAVHEQTPSEQDSASSGTQGGGQGGGATTSTTTTGGAGATRTDPGTPEVIDWSKREITGPIEGAYVVIYLSRNFVGLVVGQQYARAWYYASMPQNITAAKALRNDRRAPVGDYYICGHELDGNVMTLVLSYPSPQLAEAAVRERRITPAQQAAIVNAWRQTAPPPFTTALGGPVRIRGDGVRDKTAPGSDIGITPEQMEELWLATRKGTPVRIFP